MSADGSWTTAPTELRAAATTMLALPQATVAAAPSSAPWRRRAFRRSGGRRDLHPRSGRGPSGTAKGRRAQQRKLPSSSTAQVVAVPAQRDRRGPSPGRAGPTGSRRLVIADVGGGAYPRRPSLPLPSNEPSRPAVRRLLTSSAHGQPRPARRHRATRSRRLVVPDVGGVARTPVARRSPKPQQRTGPVVEQRARGSHRRGDAATARASGSGLHRPRRLVVTDVGAGAYPAGRTPRPQQRTEPSSSTAHVELTPAAMATAVRPRPGSLDRPGASLSPTPAVFP